MSNNFDAAVRNPTNVQRDPSKILTKRDESSDYGVTLKNENQHNIQREEISDGNLRSSMDNGSIAPDQRLSMNDTQKMKMINDNSKNAIKTNLEVIAQNKEEDYSIDELRGSTQGSKKQRRKTEVVSQSGHKI